MHTIDPNFLIIIYTKRLSFIYTILELRDLSGSDQEKDNLQTSNTSSSSHSIETDYDNPNQKSGYQDSCCKIINVISK